MVGAAVAQETSSITMASERSQSGLTCNACGISFDTRDEQRPHMKEPWHVLNLKRRVADLPPLSRASFEEQTLVKPKDSPGAASSEESDGDYGNPKQGEAEPVKENSCHCLFCSQISSTPETNLDHMLHTHSFFVSRPDCLIDPDSFLEYLRVVITDYHECLYCGKTRSSTEGIRQHMIEKGHCLLNIDAEPELLEFWEFPDSDDGDALDQEAAAMFAEKESDVPALHKMSNAEARLSSGTIIAPRSTHAPRQLNRKKRASVRAAKLRAIEAPPMDEPDDGHPPIPHPVRDRRIAVRGELGMVGVPEQQKRALMAVEKKAQKQEEVVRAARQWTLEKMTNKQKTVRRIVAKKGCVPMNAHIM